MSEESPINVPCRTCFAKHGEKCTTKPQLGGHWVRELSYFHTVRWRDFNRARNEVAAMNDWNQRYERKL